MLVWGGLLLTIAIIAGAFAWTKIRGNRPLPVIGQIPDFTLTNENNEAVSFADLKGKVWVADIIFTRCPGPCPTMTRQLARWGVTRVCPLGQMQNPPLTWRHDGRPSLEDLVTWIDWEQ